MFGLVSFWIVILAIQTDVYSVWLLLYTFGHLLSQFGIFLCTFVFIWQRFCILGSFYLNLETYDVFKASFCLDLATI